MVLLELILLTDLRITSTMVQGNINVAYVDAALVEMFINSHIVTAR